MADKDENKSQKAEETKEEVKETPKETQEETPKDPVQPKEPETPSIDTDTITENVSKNVLEKIAERFNLTKKEEDELPKDEDALKKYVDNKIKQEFENRDQEMQASEQENQKQTQEAINKQIQTWFSQYDNASKIGKVPPIKDKNDKNDPGVKARNKIIQHIGTMIKSLRAEGNNYTPTISDVLLQFPKINEIPGADLPISGDTATRESLGMDYDELHKSSWDQIVN